MEHMVASGFLKAAGAKSGKGNERDGISYIASMNEIAFGAVQLIVR